MSEHKANKPAVTVVATPTRLSKMRDRMPGRRGAIKLAIALAVLALAGFGVYSLLSDRMAADRDRQAQEAAKPKKLSDQDYGAAIEETFSSDDRKAGVKLAEEQADDSVRRQMVLASAYANDEQYDKSLTIYDEQAAKGTLTANYYSAAAGIAVDAGQKDRAIKYYEQGIEQAKKEKDQSALWESNIERYQRRIEELKK